MKKANKEIPGAILTEDESKELRAIIEKTYRMTLTPKEASIIGGNMIQALELLVNNNQNRVSEPN